MIKNKAALKGRPFFVLYVFFGKKRIPFSFDKAPQEHAEKEHVMSYHASPGGNKSHIEKLGEDKSAEYADAPHAHEVIDKRLLCFANALHHSFNDDGEAIERFRNCDHAENRGTKADYFRTVGKNVHKARCKEEKACTGNYHENKFNGDEHIGKVVHTLFIPCAVGVSVKGCRGGLHTEAGNIECGFNGICNGMGCSGNITEGVYHGRKGNKTK